jgi:hypothetical protein
MPNRRKARPPEIQIKALPAFAKIRAIRGKKSVLARGGKNLFCRTIFPRYFEGDVAVETNEQRINYVGTAK